MRASVSSHVPAVFLVCHVSDTSVIGSCDSLAWHNASQKPCVIPKMADRISLVERDERAMRAQIICTHDLNFWTCNS